MSGDAASAPDSSAVKASGRRPSLTVHEGGADGREPRPVVVIRQGHRGDAIREAERHLIANDRTIWQRGGKPVRVQRMPQKVMDGDELDLARIVAFGPEAMRLRFSDVCDLRKIDRRTKEAVTVDCPKDFAAAYLEPAVDKKLPFLHSVVTAPTLRPDGSVLSRPGYDDKSGIFLDECGVRFPHIDPAPSESAAKAALDLLLQAIAGFDLVDDISRAAAVSLLITPLVLPLLPAAPLHAVTAPVAGAGKSKLVKVSSIMNTGHPPPVMSLGERQEESEKRIAGALMSGAPMVCLDNLERPLMGEFLCQAITEPWVVSRVLNTMDLAGKYGTVLFTATGNNLALYGDMVRRVLMIRLDPNCERPELREFEGPDPCAFALQRRPELVAAALTVVRAHIVAGRPRARGPVGSFEAWSVHIRDALEWLGLADAADAMGEARRDDRVLSALRGIIAQWQAVIGDRRLPARELADVAETQGVDGWRYPDLRNALITAAGEGGKVSAARLGRWLSKVKGRIVEGYRIEDAGLIAGIAQWRVAKA